ncbi:MAG: hypothetical protein M3178_01465 [Pseudomonadota bacterium]|nr:hypothetical protein [Pseudomonadota bacterium]
MADDVTIKFTADVSGLQQGMQQATSAVEATTSALRSGAAQINASFASLSQAYGSAAAKKIATVQTSSDTELAIARQNEQARYDIALNGVKGQVSLVKEHAQTGQISRQQEFSSLLALETQREDIERQHLQFLESTYQQGTVAYAAAQRRIEELASQSALRRQEIERNVNQQIYADYRRSFEQIGSSVSSSVTGMIAGQLRLRDAARNILLQIIQGFIQARVKTVADWLAGVAAQTAATTTGEAAKTAAVTAGVAARTGAEATGSTAGIASTIGGVLKSITASAGETFAGIFGFLSPVMGPAAAGPAAAGEATVLSVAGGLAAGAWSLPGDMLAQMHKGEMVIPAGVTPWAQGVISGAANTPGVNTVHVHHSTNFNVNAMDTRSVKQFFNDHGRTIMRTINESVRTGSHIGLSKLRPT